MTSLPLSNDSSADQDAAPLAPRRRFTDGSGRELTPTLIGHGSDFGGELNCPGDLTIAGRGRGNAEVGRAFILSERANWHGEIHCEHAVLAGEFAGRLFARGKVEIRATARLQGELHAAQMAIATGAVVAADIFMTGNALPQHYTEKRDR